MTLLSSFLLVAQERLAKAGVDDPALDARVLAGAVLGLDRVTLLIQGPKRVLDERERSALDAVLTRRAAREPVGRILGSREFWGLSFVLNEATLEPRPDSETVIETALRVFPLSREGRFLDLGTGTGCLLLSLLHACPNATGLGVDLSLRAVAQARENATRLGLAARAEFQEGNWFEDVVGTFDLIVSNPPYIPSAQIKGLQDEVRLFDPPLALDGGEDGLEAYRILASHGARFLNAGGAVLFEVGIGQSEDVACLLRTGGFTDVTTYNDLAGVPRCVTGRKGP